MNSLPARREPRPLGLASQPTLRLALGYKDPAKKGAPVKTDYFVAKEGRDGEYAAAARKFREVYGEKPREIDIMLPTSIGQALDVRYRAFKGNPADDDGGVLVAVGNTNFALLGVRGGPDTLTVFEQDGEVHDIDIYGEDDPAAVALGVALYTTIRFSIPSVLGAGGVCEITSKGKKTTDNLFERLVTLYGWFGVKTPFAVRPTLVLRHASGRPVVTDKKTGETRRIRSNFFALDIRVRETLDEMVGRLAEQAALLPAGGPAAALYGARPDRPAIEAVARELTAASSPDVVSEPLVGSESGSDSQQAEGVAAAAQVESTSTGGAASSAAGAEPPIDEPVATPAFVAPKGARAVAARIKELGATPVMGHEGKTLGEIPSNGEWIKWALNGGSPQWTPEFRAIFEEWVQLAHPEEWAAHQKTHAGEQTVIE